MLRAIGFVCKCAFFAVAVLVLGNWLRWDGRTASERVTQWIHRAQRHPSWSKGAGEVAEKMGGWARGLTTDARAGAERQSRTEAREGDSRDRTSTNQAGAIRADQVSAESISPSERQKLRALIRELNSSHRRD